ncbi:(2Fe-2S)-binding protein [Streptomyces sp. NPDC093252]|uniref:(2Fe-2S)-binding protein n=1 Tax=Streptomyces sp. NPDC093252 TaxID=3154980 RepID=UPI00341737F3
MNAADSGPAPCACAPASGSTPCACASASGSPPCAHAPAYGPAPHTPAPVFDPPPSASAPAETVVRALARVSVLGRFFRLPTGGPATGWHPVQESYDRGFADLARAVADRHRTGEPRVGVSIAHLGHAARLWSPALACALLHGIVLDLISVQRADDGPGLRLARPSGWYADQLPDPVAALGDQVAAPLRAFAAGLDIKVAPRLLDGNSGSALAEAARALLAAHPERRAGLTALAGELLAREPLAGTGRFTGPDLAFRRRSCCLYYRAPAGAKCGDCCLGG